MDVFASYQFNFAQWHERVQLGVVKHETSYSRDHSTDGLFGLAPDRIDGDNCMVYENKGTAVAKEASSTQTVFYAVMLALVTGKEWRAGTQVLSSRKRREVVLDAARLQSW